ncbi:MAG TPA: FAD-dependent oxidoreductase, partial [Pirellulales bacterium]|nr:FAD-dependent oxidoreductase [Pirellulales bacterium]
MAVDTPARIAILGAGPIGLEAALYARYLGYDVDIYERGRAAENLLRWG